MTDTGGRSSWPSTSNNLLERRAGRQQFVHVKVRAMMPTEVTPDVIAWLKRDKSRRELVSRITGNPSPRFNDPIVFEAQWQPVTLSRKTIGISPEECELLDQISGTAFRELGIRVVRQGFRCDPERPSRIPPELVVEAFMPVLDGTDTAQPAPVMEEDDQ